MRGWRKWLLLVGVALAGGCAWWYQQAAAEAETLLQHPDGRVIDMHVHVAGLGRGDSGAFVNEAMRNNVRFPFYLHAMGVSEDELAESGDRVLFDRISRGVAASRVVDAAVVLALDGAVYPPGHPSAGALDRTRTQVYVPNDYVARETAAHKNLLYGASINPYRPDALQRLEEARRRGAVLVKWIPSIMHIDPADPALVPFYRRLVALGLPLLTHTGMERSFSEARDELCDPRRLTLPLSLGVTVIAAHLATTGESDGEDNFERLLSMFARYPTLYADVSSLTQLNKLGFMAEAMAHPELHDRLLYGTDWPLQFFPLVSPWFHVNHIGVDRAWQVEAIDNPWDRDVALKRAFGLPDRVLTGFDRLMTAPPTTETVP